MSRSSDGANRVFAAALGFLLFGILAALLNWACIFACHRRRRLGNRNGVSLVPLIGMASIGIAAGVSIASTPPLIPGWILALAALSDPASISLVYLPIFLLRRASRK